MTKQKRLSGLGDMNYRNIGLSFAIGVLMEIGKELDSKGKQAQDVKKAEQALSQVLQNLPDDMNEQQVEVACGVFLEMEKSILKHDMSDYRGFMSGIECEQIYDVIYPDHDDGTDYA